MTVTIIRKIGILFKESKVKGKKDKADIQDQEQEQEIQRLLGGNLTK